MRKSVLVIDTPKSCLDCELSYDCYSCSITGTKFYTDNFDCSTSILEDCPLSPIPERINLRQYVDNTACNLDSVLAYQYAQGYNNCIDDILEGDTK